MCVQQGPCPKPRSIRPLKLLGIALLLIAAARCARAGPQTSTDEATTLRVGVGDIELRQFVQNQTIEALFRVQDDGRLKASLAKSWSVSPDGLTVTLELRDGIHFHDGSPLTPEIVAEVLKRSLPQTMGPAYDDVLNITPAAGGKIELALKVPSAFVHEAFETQIERPGKRGVGTGPFVAVDEGNSTEMRANRDYYLGPPHIERIVVSTYPTMRAAWAELLRGRVDMVYEVGVDALDSLETSTTVNVFSYLRRYQFAIILNTRIPALQSPSIRRALNAAINRDLLVRDALGGHGLPSVGPVWPKNWAFNSKVPGFTFDPAYAVDALKQVPNKPRGDDRAEHRVAFSCLVASDAVRLALFVKQQLEPFGVEMDVREASLEELNKAGASGGFEAILAPIISAPTLVRPYLWWHSAGPFNRGKYASPAVDAALDSIRHAKSDDEYRAGVAEFQRSIVADPPAIFLAWDERARAVSNRFQVPSETGMDILGSLRLWQPGGTAPPSASN